MTQELISGSSEKENLGFVLEKNVRLSESKIWSLLEQFYDKASIEAWNQIPFYPTSNPYIAETYAEQIVAFLKDYFSNLKVDEPIYILEMAAGSGCFSYYLMKELKRKLSYYKHLQDLRIHYLMVDFTANNVKSWMNSLKLKPFVDSGMLKFGIFRPEQDNVVMSCPVSGQSASKIVLDKNSSPNPLIAIANYFFDSIKQDAFQIKNKELFEVRHSFYLPSALQVSDNEPFPFDQLSKEESYIPVSSNKYYEDERFNNILERYKTNIEEASVLFPLGPLACVNNLLHIANEKLVLISSDKGFTRESYLKGLREQPFLAHHGIFSYSVNYDAIAKFFESLGGVSFSTEDDNLSVSTSVSILLKNEKCELDNSKSYFYEKVDKQNLANYLYFLQDLLTDFEPKKRSNEFIRACLGFIQMANYDPIIFCLAAPRMYHSLETINMYQERRLLEIMERVADNFYSVQQQYDVYYWIGRVYYGLNKIDKAQKYFAESLLTFGESSSALYYMAACYEIKENYDQALSYYKDTLKIEPDCEYTKAGIKRIEDNLAKVSSLKS